VTNIYSRKETLNFDEIWPLCKIEETRIKEKDDTKPNEKSQAFTSNVKKRKGKFGKFEPCQRNTIQSRINIDMSKVKCFGSNEYGNFKRDFPNFYKIRRTIRERKEVEHI